MKKQTMITLALALTLAMPTLPAFAQKAMSKKEIAPLSVYLRSRHTRSSLD